MKILIAYGSSYGSTRAIAERIQAIIQNSGVGETTIVPFDKNTSPQDFDALVIGSCIHTQSWINSASSFVKRNTTYLHDNPKPTWAFSVGMPPNDKGLKLEEQAMEKWLKKSLVLRGHKLFRGAWDTKQMGGFFRFFFSCFGGKTEDKRDWGQIEGWADEIVQELRNEQQGLGPN